MTTGPTLPPVMRNERSRSAGTTCSAGAPSILALVPWPAVVAVSPPHAGDGCHSSSSPLGARRFKGDIQLPRSTSDLLSGGCSAAPAQPPSHGRPCSGSYSYGNPALPTGMSGFTHRAARSDQTVRGTYLDVIGSQNAAGGHAAEIA